MAAPSLKDRRCIWCGCKPEYRLLVQRVREQNFRQSIRFELCGEHAFDIIERLGKLLGEDPHTAYLYRHLAPRGLA